jgi:pimeloyl-ACP methyl ester carboxylesterase
MPTRLCVFFVKAGREWDGKSRPILEETRMARSDKVELCSKGLPTQATTRHRYLSARRERFAYALLVLVASVSLCAMAQTARSHGGAATQELFPLALGSAGETPALNNRAAVESGANTRRVIVIGFVGGFARQDDQGHPEVQFAEYLRDRYSPDLHAEVFGNHYGRKALHEVLRLLDGHGNSKPSSTEKEHALIILYGHSWGAAETLVFARELGKQGIPVQLTIQMDSIAKLGRDDSRIPANVANAINFYQSRGPLHGRTEIVATDPAQTTIIGNFQMNYRKGHRINCDNYPWYARVFNKPHHEIENDPRVWDLAASLIDSEVEGRTLTTLISSSWKPFVK